MLFTEKIEAITYQDVVEFCGQQHRESINLDYKQDIDASLSKTIAAMANTWGGLIVIGVEDEDSKPKLPVLGITYKEHLREQINDRILGNITPPLSPEVQVCQSGDNKTAFIVIRIPQSNLTPHAIKGNTRVYIRTDTSNKPEESASVDRLLWLVEKREKSADLKHSFYKRADERFSILCKRNGVTIEHTDFILAICPMYPFEILADYRNLQEDIPRKIAVNAWSYTFPLILFSNGDFLPTQEGTYGFYTDKGREFALYEEFNHYGFFYHREDLCYKDITGGEIKLHSLLWDILRRLDSFIEAMGKFYSELAGWGLLDLRISLNKLDDVDFKDLPPVCGYAYFDEIKVSIDHRLEFSKRLFCRDLKDKRVDLVIDLMREISWSLGFSHIKKENIRKLMVEYKRA